MCHLHFKYLHGVFVLLFCFVFPWKWPNCPNPTCPLSGFCLGGLLEIFLIWVPLWSTGFSSDPAALHSLGQVASHSVREGRETAAPYRCKEREQSEVTPYKLGVVCARVWLEGTNKCATALILMLFYGHFCVCFFVLNWLFWGCSSKTRRLKRSPQ